MGKVIPPKIHRPTGIQVTIPRDLGLVCNTYYIDSDNGKRLVFDTNDGKITIEPSTLIDMKYRSKTQNSVAQSMISSIADMVNADYNYVTKVVEYVPTSSTTKSNESVLENRFSLPKELFEAVDFTNMGVEVEPKDFIPTFIKGEKYALKGVSCEGFEMPEKVYELVAVHDEYDGININSLIVKQISGEQDKIFTLSKNDCEHIGIEYENGLQLFPKHLNWRRVKDAVPFNPSNLATTPVSDIDNTVRCIVLKINGFKDYIDGYVLTPSGKIIKEKQFENSLRIFSNEPIIYTKPTERGGSIVLREGIALNTEIVYPKGLNYNHGNFISADDTIYVKIKLAKAVANPSAVGLPESIDGLYGIEREFLEGFNPNDHFTISWDELGAYTIEEYEAEKARKEKARQERIAREEAERKKRVAEEEKRIKENRRRTEEAITRMKGFKITLPQFPKMENFNMENGLSSLNLYMDGLDIYFDSLDKSLNRLSGELNQMGKTIGINLEKRIGRNRTNSSLFDMFNL